MGWFIPMYQQRQFSPGGTRGSDQVVTTDAQAVAGGVAKIPCDISAPEGDFVHLVIWFVDHKESSIYTFDARGRIFDQAKHWADEALLGGRAYFRFNEEPARLNIEHVRKSDAGVYRCRVDFKKSPTRNSKVNLTVIIPPDSLIILDEKGLSPTLNQLGAYNEGASAEITCIATGGRPSPRVTWWQENALIDDSYERIGETRVQNILRLEKLSRRHLHAVFTCQASNNNMVAPISKAVTIDLNLRPLWVRLLDDHKPLSADNKYELSCEVVGARPQPIITWWKASVPLRNTREIVTSDRNVTTSVLTFTPMLDDSGKILTCRAEVPLIPNSMLEDGWKLNVQHVPIVSLELGSNLDPNEIREGVDVYFECNIKSNPWVYNVSWRHMGHLLTNNVTAGMIVSNQSLVLQAVTRVRAGYYTCVGSNIEGDGESTINLDVKYAPVCKSNQQTVYGVARQEAARIQCELDANPTDVTFFWKFNNTSETADLPVSHVATDRARSIATYMPMTELDYGSLLCWGKNSVGSQTQPCVFQIIPAGKPDALRNCTIVNQTANSLHVECTEGFDGGLAQEFVMEVYDAVSQNLVSNVTMKTASFTVSGLRSGFGFDVSLYAANAKGQSDPVSLQAATLKAAAKRTAVTPAMLEMTPLLGILIGVVAALILVAVVVVVVVRMRGSGSRRGSSSHIDEKDRTDDGGMLAHSLAGSIGNAHIRGGAITAALCEKNVSKDTESETLDSLDEKNPDIIPQNSDTDYVDREEKAFVKLNNVPPRLYVSPPVRPTAYDNPTATNTLPKLKEEVTYAELSHAKPVSAAAAALLQSYGTAPRRTVEPTVYAQIDVAKMGTMPTESSALPLLHHHHALAAAYHHHPGNPTVMPTTRLPHTSSPTAQLADDEHSTTAETPLIPPHREGTMGLHPIAETCRVVTGGPTARVTTTRF